MNRLKRFIIILSIIFVTMLIIPFITIHTIKAESGMAVTLILFFVVYPIVSVIIGILAGKDIKFFWFSPILVGVLFWVFACLAYQPAFPIVYSVIYFVICAISLLITWIITKKKKY